jgi:uncharacterized protein YodC (DUF2158 family)
MKRSTRHQDTTTKKLQARNGSLTLPMAIALLALAGVAGSAGISEAAKNVGQQGNCPNFTELQNFKVANNVAASFTNAGSQTTYKFISLIDEHPANGVPGLVKYCVYPTPFDKSHKITNVTMAAKGADGSSWTYGADPKDFRFGRPGGNKTNIPLDGKTTEMATVTWNNVPNDQAILLHIADAAVCTALYGSTSPDTCFVKPSQALSCTGGDSSVAYNAIPFGGVNCAPPSVGVEAYGFNELGDQVTLATGTPRTLVALKALFTSYGCMSGHWYDGFCVTAEANATFDVPITANIYKADSCGGTPVVCQGVPLASVTTTQAIQYRPSANNEKCTGADAGKWWNPDGNGGVGACQNSIAQLLTFDFSTLPAPVTLPDNVVWTVAYNTSQSGYTPVGTGTACFTSDGGCGYDSLNVGVKSYSGAPYAGTDVAEGTVFLSWWKGNTVPQYPPPNGFGVLTPPQGIQSSTNDITDTWVGYRPLGEIITK